MTDFHALIETLTDHQVAFVVIGGVALVLRGSPRATADLDICYARDGSNLSRLAAALSPLGPVLRGAPADLPFRLDERTLRSGLNFTLTTTKGDIDLLGEVTGLGGYASVKAGATSMTLFARDVLVLDLDALERGKRASGRIKDLADLAHIVEIRKRTDPK